MLILIAVLVICWFWPYDQGESVIFTEGETIRIEDSKSRTIMCVYGEHTYRTVSPMNNTASQAQAHHGGSDPPWVNEDGTADYSLMPDRMPVPDGNGGIIGYVEIDKDPSDDPAPGDSGFEDRNTQTVYASETGDEIAGKIIWDGPGGTRDFTPATENQEATPVPR